MKPSLQSASGTSYHRHSINATVEELTNILGTPRDDSNTGRDKVNYEWVAELDNGCLPGSVFTVYDWKEYRPIFTDEPITWNIGGHSKAVTAAAQVELETALRTLRTKSQPA